MAIIERVRLEREDHLLSLPHKAEQARRVERLMVERDDIGSLRMKLNRYSVLGFLSDIEVVS